MLESNKQVQTSGDNSQQTQIGTQINYYGISEERVRTIYQELAKVTLQSYAEEAYLKINKRLKNFQNYIIQKFYELKESRSAFADPSLQILLRKAQVTAAGTDNEDEYAFLAELLIYNIQKNNDRKNRAAIDKAIEIIDKIEAQALCALTVAFAIPKYRPYTGDCLIGLKSIDSLFNKLMYMDLPDTEYWLEHLEILNVVGLQRFISMKKFIELYTEMFQGYICVGIKNNSNEYDKAIKILEKSNMSTDFLIENKCFPGYSRLNLLDISFLDKLTCTIGNDIRYLNKEEKDCIKSIFKFYSHDENMLKEVKNNFINLLKGFDNINKVSAWWDSIPYAFSITHIGKILAYINARRCNSLLPVEDPLA